MTLVGATMKKVCDDALLSVCTEGEGGGGVTWYGCVGGARTRVHASTHARMHARECMHVCKRYLVFCLETDRAVRGTITCHLAF